MTWEQVPPFDPEKPAPTLGWETIAWVETFLVHGPGDVQGQGIKLDEEFQAFLLRAYELVPDGAHPKGWRRRFNRCVLSRPKGRSKSELGGMLCCFEALGPARFDGFNADGEPIGRPVTSPEVLCVATEEGQAGNTYDNVVYMLREGRVADEYRGLDVGLTRTYLPGGGSVEPITAAARSKDGGKSTFVVFDEPHLWTTPQLKALFTTIRRNLGKRGLLADPWSLETTTAPRPGEYSVAEGAHEYARAVKAGKARDSRFLFDHRQSDRSLDDVGEDRDLLIGELQESYGDAAGWMDFSRLVAELDDPETDPADWERYYQNRLVTASDAFVGRDEWDGLPQEASWRPEQSQTVVAGFDGSRFKDATAVVGLEVASGRLFTVGIWERPVDVDDWEVPRDEVTARVDEMFDRWDVARFYCDPPDWDVQIADWRARHGDPVNEWWTHRPTEISKALKEFKTAVRARDVGHDADPQLADHVLNARLRKKKAVGAPDDENRELWSIHKPPGGRRKIDACMAAVLAWKARGDAIAGGALTAKKKRRTAFL